MLTAFTARPIVELNPRVKAKIESLVAYGDRLLVGLNTGVLRVYKVNEQAEAAAVAAAPVPASAPSNTQEAAAKNSQGAPKTGSSTTPSAAASAASSTPPTLLLREVEKFAPRAVEQLAIIKEANTLVSLANYAVSLHDLQSFASLPGAAPLPGTKNASCFAVTSNIVKDPATGIPEIVSRLAVAVKRRLLLWNWYASELSGGGGEDGGNADSIPGTTPLPEITLAETIRSLTWASATKLVVGMNAGYVLVDVLTRTVEDIVEGPAGSSGSNGANGGSDAAAAAGVTGMSATSRFGAFSSASMGYMGLGSYMPKPLAAKLADGQVLLAKDVHTLFITDQGKPVEGKRPIPWPAAPESIGYSYPYILALQPPAKGSLEVRNPDTLSLLQTVALPGAAQLHVPPPSVSLAHAGKGFHVSSERGIWKMDATGYDSQVETLVAHGHLDEAISLLGLLEDALLRDKAATLRRVKMQKAEWLFRQKKYLASMDLFNEEDVHAPPERVLRFFPRSIAGDLSDEPAPEEEEAETAAEDKEGGEDETTDAAAAAEASTTDDDTEAAAANGSHPQQSNGASNGADGAGTTAAAASAPIPPPSPAPSAKSTAKLQDRTTSPPPPPEVSSSLPRSAAGGFTKMFLGHRKVNSETASIASVRKDGSTSDTASIKGKPATAKAAKTAAGADATPPAANKNGYVPLEGKELMKAAEALNSYLAGTRARLQRVIDPATGKLKPGASAKSKSAVAKLRQQQKTRPSAATTDESDNPNEDDDSDDDDAAREKRLRATFTLVDTTMFRVLMLIRPTLASSLFRIPNFCDPDVVNERLLATSRYNELVDFFYGKRLHRQALELLRRFGEEKTERTGKTEEEEGGVEDVVPPALRGPQRTIAYLQSLPPEMIDLVLEFAAWTLRADPARGMDVFLADSENAETLPRDRVVRFLAGIDPRLEMRYLEHVIGELNDLTPYFHDRLIEQMIRLLKEGRSAADKPPEGEAETDEHKAEREEWEATMARLVAFLRESGQYGLSRAFSQIPRDDPLFYEAQAVVLSNMDQHKQALEIYVFKMKDFAKAEEYCNRIHKAQELAQPTSMSSSGPLQLAPTSNRSRRTSTSRASSTKAGGTGNEKDNPDEDDAAAPPSIYHTLLSLYLTPPPGQERQLAPALDLLSRHGSRLPASSTLQLIPDALPVADLAAYFRGRMRAANSVVNETRIEKGLRQTAVLAAQAALLLGEDAGGSGSSSSSSPYGYPPSAAAGRNRRVVVSEDRVCGVCHKRLGGSVVAVLPDNSVVHYGCLNRAGGGGSSARPSVDGRSVSSSWR